MRPVIAALRTFLGSLFRSRRSLALQVLALQHQVAVYQQTVHRPRLRPSDRLFWAWLSRLWPGWQATLAVSSLIISGRRLDYITIPSLHSARIAGPSG
jgi:hypothetical protein